MPPYLGHTNLRKALLRSYPIGRVGELRCHVPAERNCRIAPSLVSDTPRRLTLPQVWTPPAFWGGWRLSSILLVERPGTNQPNQTWRAQSEALQRLRASAPGRTLFNQVFSPAERSTVSL
jgi:hypothetical protein